MNKKAARGDMAAITAVTGGGSVHKQKEQFRLNTKIAAAVAAGGSAAIARRNLTTFKCGHVDCPKEYSTQKSLIQHKKCHLKVKVACKHVTCDKSFTTKQQMENHVLNKHRTARPHKCQKPGCTKGFALKSGLKAHK